MNRFLGDESVSLPDTTSIQLLHVHVELLQSFLFFGICTRVYCIFSSAFTARICDLDFSDLDFFFLIFCWIARS